MEGLKVCKKALPNNQMSNVDTINQAAKWSRDLSQMRARGPGDLENAMRSIERDYGIDYWFQWSLRYRARRLKDIGHSVFQKLRAAHEAECARQMRRLQHDIEITKAITGADCPAVRAAEALVREDEA